MLITLFQTNFFQNLYKEIEFQSPLVIEDLWAVPKATIIAALAIHLKRPVICLSEKIEESQFLENLPLLYSQGEILHFPAWETLPTENIPPSPDIVGQRFSVLEALQREDASPIVLLNLQAALQKVVHRDVFSRFYRKLKVGEEVLFEELIEYLASIGYERRNLVIEKGEFAVRGGIIDIFCSYGTEPYRIEFFGDEIESIRSFDPIGQKSLQELETVALYPANELHLVEKHPATFWDFLPENALIVVDNPKFLSHKFAEFESFWEDAQTPLLISLEDLAESLEFFPRLFFPQNLFELKESIFLERSEPKLLEHNFQRLQEVFVAKNVHKGVSDTESLINALYQITDDYELHFYASTESEEKHLKEFFATEKIDIPATASFHRGYLSGGFALNDIRLACLPYPEIFKRYKIRRQKQRGTFHTTPVTPFELEVGDYVVHLTHGIGKFLGFTQKANHMGVETDFMQVEYSNNAKLFIPLDQAHLVSKYIGAHNEKPKLHTIGGANWTKTKVKTERAINDYASDLLNLYAERKLSEGVAFPQDTEEMLRFEEEFPYVETEDQLQAIKSIKEDMITPRPMDRLICGDVGYGKTEVAIRAAFKAVVEGGVQVAVLVPTTVLALQHFETFSQRMQNFPINIAHISRFVSRKESKEILEKVEKGQIDILIGTHRILGKDIIFRNLGLILIDEEQRFGVKAKEHLKRMKIGVDYLTLSATPIPRTLYMSLVGVRDLSVINTPPQDRLPVKTIVAEFDDKMIKTALQRELARGGQAYVIHNRVESLHKFALKIQTLVPEAKVVIGHGQMDAESLDEVFHAFKQGDADIFIGTTIVENGIDIPNANTIIIDRADQFGLADLYQLRGRVGRWNRRSYAYLVTPPNRIIPEVAQKRLNALVDSGGYGGGMKIAMRDLEIRGGGEILGVEQSGHVSAIGFHLYCRLLKQTIARMQGEAPKIFVDTRLELPFDARISEDYIEARELRMEIYQRLGEAQKNEEIDSLYQEMIDRFGKPTEPIIWLFALAKVKLFASLKGLLSVTYSKGKLRVSKRVKGKILDEAWPYTLPQTPETAEKGLIEELGNKLHLFGV